GRNRKERALREAHPRQPPDGLRVAGLVHDPVVKGTQQRQAPKSIFGTIYQDQDGAAIECDVTMRRATSTPLESPACSIQDRDGVDLAFFVDLDEAVIGAVDCLAHRVLALRLCAVLAILDEPFDFEWRVRGAFPGISTGHRAFGVIPIAGSGDRLVIASEL